MHRILLIEDDPGIRRAVKRMLERKSFEVSAFVSFSDLLDRYDALQSYDAVISDYELNDSDTGLDVLAYLAATVPVLILYTGQPELAELDRSARPEPELARVVIVPKETDITEYVDTTLRQR